MPLYASALQISVNKTVVVKQVIKSVKAHPCHQTQAQQPQDDCQTACKKGHCSSLHCPHFFYSMVSTQPLLSINVKKSPIFTLFRSKLPKNTNTGIDRPPRAISFLYL